MLPFPIHVVCDFVTALKPIEAVCQHCCCFILLVVNPAAAGSPRHPPVAGAVILTLPHSSETAQLIGNAKTVIDSPGKIIDEKQILLTSMSYVTSQVRSK